MSRRWMVMVILRFVVTFFFFACPGAEDLKQLDRFYRMHSFRNLHCISYKTKNRITTISCFKDPPVKEQDTIKIQCPIPSQVKSVKREDLGRISLLVLEQKISSSWT